MKRKIFAVIAAALPLMQSPGPLFAQSESRQDPCQAKPDGRSDGNMELTEKLDRCGGVLKPPSSADREIEKQPPATGSTPIIPPGDLPDQPRPR